MAEPLSTNNDDTGRVTVDHLPPKYEWQQHLWFDPVAIFQLACRELEDCKAQKAKRDYYTNLLRRYFVPFLLALAVLSVSISILYAVGFFESNRVIAAFTVVLAVVGIIQWVISHQQWQTVMAQNEILAAQTQQTDATIEEMRLEQRAWLGAGKAKINPIEVGKLVSGEFTMTNSGRTPAFVRIGVADSFLCTEENIEGKADHFLRCARLSPGRQDAIPPSAKRISNFHSTITIDQPAFHSINGGQTTLYVFGYYAYFDLTKKTLRETRLCLRYDREAKALLIPGSFHVRFPEISYRGSYKLP